MSVGCKKNLVTLSVIMALIILVQPGWARESSRKQDGRGTADKSRTQSVKPAEKDNSDRSGRNESNQPTIPEPRHWLGNENRQTSDRPAGREFNFSKPDMRVERNNPGIQKNIADPAGKIVAVSVDVVVVSIIIHALQCFGKVVESGDYLPIR